MSPQMQGNFHERFRLSLRRCGVPCRAGIHNRAYRTELTKRLTSVVTPLAYVADALKYHLVLFASQSRPICLYPSQQERL